MTNTQHTDRGYDDGDVQDDEDHDDCSYGGHDHWRGGGRSDVVERVDYPLEDVKG